LGKLMVAHKAGFYVIHYNVGETLTWVTPQGTIEPWLAESLTNLSPTAWRVKLRPDATFWDGSPVNAAAVAAAFRFNWDTQAAATTLIDKATTVTVVDPLTLDFATPRPAGNFPNALSATYFVVSKGEGKFMTGMYRTATFEVDKELVIEPHPGHWGGPPPLAKITVKNVVDANTRALVLQSGEVDIAGNILPETLSTFGPEIATISIPSTRVHTVLLNPRRGVFADRQVREATAYAVDRAALRRVVFNDQGAAQATVFPAAMVPDQVQLQTLDQARARQLLDEAGWVAGADGIRAKGGARLAFTMLSYPSRPELTQLAIAIQAQLKALGYEMQVREVQSINDELAKGEYDASMYSLNTLYTGDPYFHYNIMFAQDGTYNFTKTPIPGMDALLTQLREAADPARRQAISRQIQEVVRTNVPALYLISAPLIYAYNKAKVADFTPDPQDQYFIGGAIRAR
jgi:peptide/nickel transport system substrate-binding protein